MINSGCPGARSMRRPKPELFTCPDCNGEVEIWSDEFSARCPSCGTAVLRDGTMSCLEWCAMARECVGDSAFDSFNRLKAESIKERLLKTATEAVREEHGDARLAEQTLHYAEILANAGKADLHVVLAGAVLTVLYDGQPDRARKELLQLGFQLEDADEVCRMIEAPDDSRTKDTMNFAVVHDARLLASKDERERAGKGSTASSVQFLTSAGSRLAG